MLENIVIQSKDIEKVIGTLELLIGNAVQRIFLFSDFKVDQRVSVKSYIDKELKPALENKNLELISFDITLGADPYHISQHIINQIYDQLYVSVYWKELPLDLRRNLEIARKNGLEKIIIRKEDINRISNEMRRSVGVQDNKAAELTFNISLVVCHT